MNNQSLSSLSKTLQDHRKIGDFPADLTLEQSNVQELYALFDSKSSNAEFFLRAKSSVLRNLASDVEHDFNSLNQDKLIAGQRVFQKYAMEVMTMLGLYSLPYCYAAAEGAKVLVLSKYILDNPTKRLQETGEFVISSNQVGAFDKNAQGLMAIVKVRLMHAVVRKFASEKIEYETPINQEDMLGTNLSFSIIIIRGLKKIGIELTKQEVDDYLYLWFGIGVMLGIKKDLLPENIKEASILESIIRERQFRESDEGKVLTDSLINLFKTNWKFSPIKPESIVAELVGSPYSQYIGLKSSLDARTAISIMKMKNLSKSFSESNFDGLLKQIQRMKVEV